jgi:hypothetical protein
LTIWPRASSGAPDDAALGHRRVQQQRRFDLGAGDVVAAADDHVVGARLVDELAVVVDQVGVAGQVPAVLHIVGLALVGQVLAAGGALDRQPADLAARQFAALLVEHAGAVARHRQPGGAGLGVGLVGADEDVEQLGASRCRRSARCRWPASTAPRGRGQRLAGRHALAQARQVVLRRPAPRPSRGTTWAR